MTDIHKRAKKGIQQLLLRQGFIQVFTFVGGVILARTLEPAEFGIFGVTTFLVRALALLGDFGMGPSLIQRKHAITPRDLHVGFTLQQLLVSIIVVVLWFAAPTLAGFYASYDQEMLIWLVRVMAISLYLNTWRAVSVLKLERKLDYGKLARVEVVESLSYQVTAVVLAVMGFGVWSLVAAVLLRGVLGTVLIYAIAPWQVRFAIDWEKAWSMVSFGVPFQVQRSIGKVRTWVTPTLVAVLIGPDAVGFLMWASSNGRKPMTLIRNVVRVSLPHFSRIQDQEDQVERVLSRYVLYFLLPCGLWFALLLTAGHDLVTVIYTEKWLAAVPALVLYTFMLNLNAMSIITKTAISSVGRVRFVMRVTLFTTVTSILLSVVLVFRIGFIGVPIGEIIALMFSIPWLFKGLQPGAMRRVLQPAAWLAAPIGFSALIGFSVSESGIALLWLRALVTSLAVTLVYAGTVWTLGPGWLRQTGLRYLHQAQDFVQQSWSEGRRRSSPWSRASSPPRHQKGESS